MLLTTIFFHVDEFCKEYEKFLKKTLIELDKKHPGGRPPKMRLSEVLTIAIFWHHSKYRTFKDYYENMVCKEFESAFSNMVSYNRMVELLQESLLPLTLFSLSKKSTKNSEIFFIDSFKLNVCHNARISSHKVFKGLAQRGKTSTGWFYGFKVHLVINHHGEAIAFCVTPGNVSDCNIDVVCKLTKNISGLLFGDRGYISSKLFHELFARGIKLITRVRENMKNVFMHLKEKILLRKRGVIESVNGLLKTSLQIEHTRHRNVTNFFVNIVSAFIAYNFREHKPSIKIEEYGLSTMN